MKDLLQFIGSLSLDCGLLERQMGWLKSATRVAKELQSTEPVVESCIVQGIQPGVYVFILMRMPTLSTEMEGHIALRAEREYGSRCACCFDGWKYFIHCWIAVIVKNVNATKQTHADA